VQVAVNTATAALESHITTNSQDIINLRNVIGTNLTNTLDLLNSKLNKSGGVVTGDLEINGDLTLDGNLTLSTNLGMQFKRITQLGLPTQPNDAVNKSYADLHLLTSGGTMTGDLNMQGNALTNVGNPVQLHHAVNKQYLDNMFSDNLRNALTAAVAGTATEAYVDDAEEALNTRIDNVSQRVAALERILESRR
jgi:hypothetical protein